MMISYRELVMEDGEQVVTAAEGEAVQPAFDTPVKNYRIMDGMGVTFHCKMAGKPLPKVQSVKSQKNFIKCTVEKIKSQLILNFWVNPSFPPDCLV